MSEYPQAYPPRDVDKRLAEIEFRARDFVPLINSGDRVAYIWALSRLIEAVEKFKEKAV